MRGRQKEQLSTTQDTGGKGGTTWDTVAKEYPLGNQAVKEKPIGRPDRWKGTEAESQRRVYMMLVIRQEGLTAQETSVRRAPMLTLGRRLCRRPVKSLTSCFLRMDMMQKQDRQIGSGEALLEAVKV